MNEKGWHGGRIRAQKWSKKMKRQREREMGRATVHFLVVCIGVWRAYGKEWKIKCNTPNVVPQTYSIFLGYVV